MFDNIPLINKGKAVTWLFTFLFFFTFPYVSKSQTYPGAIYSACSGINIASQKWIMIYREKRSNTSVYPIQLLRKLLKMLTLVKTEGNVCKCKGWKGLIFVYPCWKKTVNHCITSCHHQWRAHTQTQKNRKGGIRGKLVHSTTADEPAGQHLWPPHFCLF